MFIIYNVIYKQKVVLVNSLLVKTKLCTEIKKSIKNLTYCKLISIAKEIKETNRYTNAALIVLKR